MKIIKRLRSLPGDSLGVIRRTPPLVFAMAVLSLGGFIGASTVLVRGSECLRIPSLLQAQVLKVLRVILLSGPQVRATGKTQIDSFNKHKESNEKIL